MSDLCGQKVDEHHSHWNLLLPEWMLAMQKYHHVTKDAPYWYNERANVGLLAAAAWRCGYVALEEYGDTKRRGKSDGQSDSGDERDFGGRIDLWIGRHDDSHGEIIEAKLAWLSDLHDKTKTKAALKKGMALARGAAKESKTGKGATLGLTFFVPGVSPDTADIDGQINSLIEIACAQPYSVVAWCFPELFRNTLLGFNGLYYPGVLLIGQRVWRGH